MFYKESIIAGSKTLFLNSKLKFLSRPDDMCDKLSMPIFVPLSYRNLPVPMNAFSSG